MKKRLLLFLIVLFAVGFSTLPAQDTVADRLAREQQEQTGTAITIIFDDSGSMNADSKLAQAKSAFLSWLKNVPQEYKLSLITFQGGGRILIPLGENNRASVTQAVGNMVANSSTPICAALLLAERQITSRRLKVTPYERHVVLLFTDGQETQDPRGISGVQHDIEKLRTLNVEVAGVGFHGQGDYMNGVATRYYSAEDEVSLAKGLSKIDAEIGDTSDIVVSNEELAEMKKISPAPTSSLAGNSAATPVQTVAPVAAPKKKFSFGTLFFIIIGFLILRSFFGKKK